MEDTTDLRLKLLMNPLKPPVEIEEVQIEGLSDETAIEETENYLKMIAIGMGIDDIQISHEIDGKYVTFQMESAKAALLIGKRGQTLNALQQLAQLVTNKSASQFKVVRVDVGDYRETSRTIFGTISRTNG